MADAGQQGIAGDWRDIRMGWEIPSENYSDQPYIVKTDDGAWLCVLTTGRGREGQRGQHIITTRSTDQGRTWSEPVAVEPADGPEASYAVILKVPSGRVYCFYNHNTDELPWVKADDPPYKDGKCYRVDSLGYFVFKYSDDHGRSWSQERYPIPVREMAIDRENAYGGQIRFFWTVGKAFTYRGSAYVPLHKVGGFGAGFFTRSEGVLLRSPNLCSEADPKKIVWETLPDGEEGLRTPPGGGPIAEEQSFSVLSDGSFFCVYRTVDGHPACSYSRDGGHTWSTPEYMRFADGRLVKHPRAANFAWRCQNGKFLYWFHNHGGRGYEDRNPAWLCCGVEQDSPEGKVLVWSEPEIVLYDDDTFVRMSYPDMVEDEGALFLTETQKNIARIHKIDGEFLSKLWNQFEAEKVASTGLVLSLPEEGEVMPRSAPMPKLPHFIERDPSRADYGTKDLRAGFSIDVWLDPARLVPGERLLDSRSSDGRGLLLQAGENDTVRVVLSDGRTESSWASDPGLIGKQSLQHIVVNVDGGPRIITFIVNGRLCDGGEHRQFGWGRFNPNLRHVNGSESLSISQAVRGLRLYDRCLMTSEAAGNFRAGL